MAATSPNRMLKVLIFVAVASGVMWLFFRKGDLMIQSLTNQLSQNAVLTERQHAARELVRILEENPDKQVPERTRDSLLQLLEEEDPILMQEAAYYFSNRKLCPELVVPKLILRLNSDDRTAKIAATALGFYGTDGKAAIGPLLATYEERYDVHLKSIAVASLAEVSPDDERVATLMNKVEAGGPLLARIEAAGFLFKKDGNGRQRQSAFLEGLASDDETTRYFAVNRIQKYAVADPRIVDAALAVLDDDEPRVRLAACRAIAVLAVFPEKSMQALLNRFAIEPLGFVRSALLDSIGSYGELARPLLPDLRLAAATDKSSDVRQSAQSAIRNIEASGK